MSWPSHSTFFSNDLALNIQLFRYGEECNCAEILIRKCLPFLTYGLDAVFLDSNSIKLVTQVWNCAFRWLYRVGQFTSTRHLFDNHGILDFYLYNVSP